jgi:hypothetical protein
MFLTQKEVGLLLHRLTRGKSTMGVELFTLEEELRTSKY